MKVVSQGRKKAEIILTPKGQGHPFTRHLLRKNGKWVDRDGNVYNLPPRKEKSQ